jgi:HEPN domain-containing protein
MSLAKNPDARAYYLPARRRLEDAKVLLENHRHDGAMYLAGFAVECLFKALILANSTPRQRAGLLGRLKTEIGHDLDELRKELARRRLHLGKGEQEAFLQVNTWDNNQRYDSRVQSREDAEAVSAAAESLFDWADRVGGK